MMTTMIEPKDIGQRRERATIPRFRIDTRQAGDTLVSGHLLGGSMLLGTIGVKRKGQEKKRPCHLAQNRHRCVVEVREESYSRKSVCVSPGWFLVSLIQNLMTIPMRTMGRRMNSWPWTLCCLLWTSLVSARLIYNPTHPIAPPTSPTKAGKIEKDYVLAVNKTYVINLDFRRDRMEFLAKRLFDVGIPYERFSAINLFHGVAPLAESVVATRFHPATKMNLTMIRDDFDAAHIEHQRNWGSTGCWQSHLQVLFDIAHGTASFLPGPFLILEDDVNVAENIDFYLSDDFLTHVVPHDWEMVFYSTRTMACHDPQRNGTYKVDNGLLRMPKESLVYVKQPQQLCRIARTYKSSGYLLRHQGIVRKLIDLLNIEGAGVIDRMWNPSFDRQDIIAYAVYPNPIWQRDEAGSNIYREEQTTITNDPLYASLLQHRTTANQSQPLFSHVRTYNHTATPVPFKPHNLKGNGPATTKTSNAPAKPSPSPANHTAVATAKAKPTPSPSPSATSPRPKPVPSPPTPTASTPRLRSTAKKPSPATTAPRPSSSSK